MSQAARKIDPFESALHQFQTAHKSVLDLDRKKLQPARQAGEALIRMRQVKGYTVAALLAELKKRGIKISEQTHNRYVKVASKYDEGCKIAKRKKIDPKTLGYVEFLDLLPLSEHSQKVKEAMRKKKEAIHAETQQPTTDSNGNGQPQPTQGQPTQGQPNTDLWEQAVQEMEAEVEAADGWIDQGDDSVKKGNQLIAECAGNKFELSQNGSPIGKFDSLEAAKRAAAGNTPEQPTPATSRTTQQPARFGTLCDQLRYIDRDLQNLELPLAALTDDQRQELVDLFDEIISTAQGRLAEVRRTIWHMEHDCYAKDNFKVKRKRRNAKGAKLRLYRDGEQVGEYETMDEAQAAADTMKGGQS